MIDETSQTVGNNVVEERKLNAVKWIKEKKDWIVYALLAVVIWFSGIVIRTSNMSGLKDATTGKWTLAPDLDPFLFLRWAKEIATDGYLFAVDPMRYVPFVYDTTHEMPFVSYAIAYLYKFLHMFNSNVTVEYAAVILPVVFFCLSMVAFFLMVKEIFWKNEYKNIIALVSTAILSVMPGFLHRTLAGVPEKESIAFLFIFLTIYFLLKAWHTEGWKKSAMFGLFAGIATGFAGLAWGGVEFVFTSVALCVLIAFFACDFKFKDKLAYTTWLVAFTAMLLPLARFGTTLFTKASSAPCYAVLGVFIFYWLMQKTPAFKGNNIPPKLYVFIIMAIIGALALWIFSPSVFYGVIDGLKGAILTPFEGNRFTVTVAENARTYLSVWQGTFGYLFWPMIVGSILLFYDGIKHFGQKAKRNLLIGYILLTFGMVFTRISPSSLFNGDNFISVLCYIGTMVLFLCILVYEYYNNDNWNIDIAIVMLLSMLIIGFLTARGAVRMLYMLYPIAPIIISYTLVQGAQIAIRQKDEMIKLIVAIITIAVIFLTAYSVYQFSIGSYNEARGSVIVGNPYYIQWWNAMDWVRDNTPTDAVFSHWWDYGYYVQTMGERATILDGGNFITYWDYLMGHEVLTASSEQQAGNFMKTHGSEYLLIDSSDIGKYPAFASIGSDAQCGQYAWIPTFLGSSSGVRELRNETQYILQGGTGLDEDVKYNGETFIRENSGLGALIISVSQSNNSFSFNQPKAIFMSYGKQTEVPFNCVFYQGRKTTFSGGIDACVYLMPQVTQSGVLPIGGGVWLSPRLRRSQFTKFYLFNEVEQFTLVHSEPNIIITQLNQQYGFNLPEITLYGGEIMGPIKIWKMNENNNFTANPEFLKTDYPDQRLFSGMCT